MPDDDPIDALDAGVIALAALFDVIAAELDALETGAIAAVADIATLRAVT